MTNFVTLTSCVQPHPSVKMNNRFFFKNKKSLHTCDKFQDLTLTWSSSLHVVAINVWFLTCLL